MMHLLDTASDNGREVLLVCPDCPRRIVLKRPAGETPGDMIVIDRGDFYSNHMGGVGPVTLTEGVPR